MRYVRHWAPLLLALVLAPGIAHAAPEPTLVRLSIWGPPAARDSIAAVYETTLEPVLIQYGFTPSIEPGRPTIDSVYARLLEIPSAADFEALRSSVQGDSVWRQALHVDADTAAATGPYPTRRLFELYRMPAGPGRTVAARPGARLGDWEILDVTSGLASNLVHHVTFDADGSVWFTHAFPLGVSFSRYDGLRVTTYDISDVLRGGIRTVRPAPSGGLWFIKGRRLWRFDGRVFEVFDAADGLPQSGFSALHCAVDGRVWIGTWVGDVERLEEAADGGVAVQRITPQERSAGPVTDLLEDGAGRIWIATRAGVYIADGNRVRPLDGPLEGQRVNALSLGPDGAVWLAATAGIYRHDGGHLALVEATEDSTATVLHFLVDSEGILWTVTDAGIRRRDGRDVVEYPDTVVEKPYSFSEGPNGAIWVGTQGGGVARTALRSIRTWNSPYGEVFSLLERASGEIWLGTTRSTYRFDEGGFTEVFEGAAATRYAFDMAEDRQGRVWWAQPFGDAVWRSEGDAAIRVSDQDGKVIGYASDILPTDNGDVWLFRGGEWERNGQRGFIRRSVGDRIERYTVTDGFLRDGVSDACQSPSGDLWFAHGSGVSRLEAGQQPGPETITTFDPPLDVWSRSILCSENGVVWAGGADGLSRFDPLRQAWIYYTDRPAWAIQEIWGLAQDRAGNLLIGRGGADFVQFDGQVFQTLNRFDGLSSGTVFGAHQDRDGAIWLNTSTGITRYRPSLGKPSLVMEEVVADRHYAPDEEIAFASTQPRVEITYQGFDLKTRPEAMVYRYRLAGRDTAWATTNETSVTYEDLPTGDYTFEVQAVDRDLGYSDLASLPFRIHPPYGQLALVVGLIVAIGLVGWQSVRVVRRDRRLNRANKDLQQTLEEKEQAQEALVRSESLAAIGTLAAGAAHELNNPLGAAASLVQSVREMVEEDTADELEQDREIIVEHLNFSHRELGRAKDIVASLLDLSSQSQQYNEDVDLQTVAQDALRGLRSRYAADQVIIEEEYQVDLPTVQGNFAQLVQVALNLIDNAVQALEDQPGTITLKTYVVNDQAIFECTDTGPGIPEAVRQDIFKPFFTTKAPGEGTGLGLYVCHQIIDKHGGSIEMESAADKGTIFRVRLPIA